MSEIMKKNEKALEARRLAVKIAASLKRGKTWDELYGVEKTKAWKEHYKAKFSGANNPNHGNGLKIAGCRNPNWKGGLSFEPYSPLFNKFLKEHIRERDGYVCQQCGKSEDEELASSRKRLAIHHIDYNKENCKKNNLITLCCRCNSKANFQRDKWTGYYSKKTCLYLGA